MTRSTAAGNRFRTRKLSTKQSLAVLRESQIDSIDDDGQRYIPQIESGVDQREEIEHHLQAAISASQAAVVGGQVPQIYIPTPDASKTISEYEASYPKRFSQPTSYIRFSSTVEDCCGTAYCMDSDDDTFLQKLNSNKRSAGAQICSEDVFEEVVQHFENTVAARQPYLHTDVSNILNYEEMELVFDENFSSAAKSFALAIYDHWKERRIKRGGRPIMPTIRIESGADKDDDPYVCFRKFEHRQVRKTRRTDAQSTEKLKKLRQEMEMARAIVADVLSREKLRKESLLVSQNVFELRAKVKEFKRKTNMRGDDEDLYDSNKTRKPNISAPSPAIRSGGPGIARAASDIRPPEAELIQLSEAQRKKVDKWRGAVEAGQQKRSLANIGFEDYTEMPISDIDLSQSLDGYRGVQTFFLPSPPPSLSPANSPREHKRDEPVHLPTIHSGSFTQMRQKDMPMYRRRIGRGGRLMIDRKNISTITQKEKDAIDEIVLDRFKYDNFEDEPIFEYPVDYNSTFALQYRARMLSPPAEHTMPQYALRRPEQVSPQGNLTAPSPMTRL